jgi:coatomer protein complex subunit alpha (xenin)
MFDTLSGHTGNVNSVVFHPKADILISASEDKSIKIWNFTTRKEIYTYTNKELDRFLKC